MLVYSILFREIQSFPQTFLRVKAFDFFQDLPPHLVHGGIVILDFPINLNGLSHDLSGLVAYRSEELLR